ncbi:MAG: prolipoprotein diacylglyceryl transferase [Candidatus Moranbacteria bacterium]|nr:prolipoprotein diacylglyceryl transferase [Candidatus Moranbacteria bacterium]
MEKWQYIPLLLDPIAFTIGFFSVRWYALFFLGSAFLVFFFMRRNIFYEGTLSQEQRIDLFFILFFGAFIGGRVGYFVFYSPESFFENPLSIFSPYDFERKLWVGLSGMSYHGGILGALFSLRWFTWKKRLSFWRIADSVILFVPLVTFFGRVGNFFNLELFGRVTEKPWGMFFLDTSSGNILRHPSSLYEAFFEGLFLFGAIFFLRRFIRIDGLLTCLYILLYAVVRFGVEYFREPDAFYGIFFLNIFPYGLSFGQILSFFMFLLGSILFWWLQRKKNDTIKTSNN